MSRQDSEVIKPPEGRSRADTDQGGLAAINCNYAKNLTGNGQLTISHEGDADRGAGGTAANSNANQKNKDDKIDNSAENPASKGNKEEKENENPTSTRDASDSDTGSDVVDDSVRRITKEAENKDADLENNKTKKGNPKVNTPGNGDAKEDTLISDTDNGAIQEITDGDDSATSENAKLNQQASSAGLLFLISHFDDPSQSGKQGKSPESSNASESKDAWSGNGFVCLKNGSVKSCGERSDGVRDFEKLKQATAEMSCALGAPSNAGIRSAVYQPPEQAKSMMTHSACTYEYQKSNEANSKKSDPACNEEQNMQHYENNLSELMNTMSITAPSLQIRNTAASVASENPNTLEEGGAGGRHKGGGHIGQKNATIEQHTPSVARPRDHMWLNPTHEAGPGDQTCLNSPYEVGSHWQAGSYSLSKVKLPRRNSWSCEQLNGQRGQIQSSGKGHQRWLEPMKASDPRSALPFQPGGLRQYGQPVARSASEGADSRESRLHLLSEAELTRLQKQFSSDGEAETQRLLLARVARREVLNPRKDAPRNGIMATGTTVVSRTWLEYVGQAGQRLLEDLCKEYNITMDVQNGSDVLGGNFYDLRDVQNKLKKYTAMIEELLTSESISSVPEDVPDDDLEEMVSNGALLIHSAWLKNIRKDEQKKLQNTCRLYNIEKTVIEDNHKFSGSFSSLREVYAVLKPCTESIGEPSSAGHISGTKLNLESLSEDSQLKIDTMLGMMRVVLDWVNNVGKSGRKKLKKICNQFSIKMNQLEDGTIELCGIFTDLMKVQRELTKFTYSIKRVVDSEPVSQEYLDSRAQLTNQQRSNIASKSGSMVQSNSDRHQNEEEITEECGGQGSKNFALADAGATEQFEKMSRESKGARPRDPVVPPRKANGQKQGMDPKNQDLSRVYKHGHRVQSPSSVGPITNQPGKNHFTHNHPGQPIQSPDDPLDMNPSSREFINDTFFNVKTVTVDEDVHNFIIHLFNGVVKKHIYEMQGRYLEDHKYEIYFSSDSKQTLVDVTNEYQSLCGRASIERIPVIDAIATLLKADIEGVLSQLRSENRDEDICINAYHMADGFLSIVGWNHDLVVRIKKYLLSRIKHYSNGMSAQTSEFNSFNNFYPVRSPVGQEIGLYGRGVGMANSQLLPVGGEMAGKHAWQGSFNWNLWPWNKEKPIIKCKMLLTNSTGSRIEFITLQNVHVLILCDSLIDPKLIGSAEVVVNPCDNRLSMGGGLSEVISKAAGNSIEHECAKHVRKNGYIKVSDFFCTKSGDLAKSYLNLKYIIHVVGPDPRPHHPYGPRAYTDSQTEKLTSDTYFNCLVFVNSRLKQSSIALPPLGAGVYKVPVPLIVRAMIDALQRLDQYLADRAVDHFQHLRNVYFVSNDENLVKEMVLEFRKYVEKIV